MYNVGMKKNRFISLVILLAAGLGACASPPEDIPATYVSMKTYAGLTCEQIEAELESNAEKTSELQFILKDKADVDAAQMGIGVIFFPTLLFLEGGSGEEAKEFARLKGARRALSGQVGKQDCAIDLNDTDVTLAAEACRDNAQHGGKECPPAIVRRVPLLR